jgi:hypothetical protein
MKKVILLTVIVLSSLIILSTYWLLNNKKMSNTPEPVVDTTTIQEDEKIFESTKKSYTNGMFESTYTYPVGWFGPEIYKYENGFRFEIGTDTVYPYGTDPSERKLTKENSYYIVAQLDAKSEDMPAEDFRTANIGYKQIEALKDLKPGESKTDARTVTTKVRDINANGLKGVEYITTLSEEAQTEHLYMREAVLVNETTNTVVVVRGTPENVYVAEGLDWKEVYEAIDLENSAIFSEFVDDVRF